MKKEALSIAIAILLSLNVATSVRATDDSINGSLESKRSELEVLSDELIEVEGKLSSLQNEITNLNSTIEKNEQDIININEEIRNTNLKMETLKAELEEVEKILAKRVRAFYKSNTTGVPLYLEFLLESKNFSDLFSKINSMSKIVELDNKLMDEQQQKNIQLQKSIEDLNTKKNNIEELNKDTESKLNDLKVKEVELERSKEKVNIKIEAVQFKIVQPYIDIVYSEESTELQLRRAVNFLIDMKKQITSQAVLEKMGQAIQDGSDKIEAIKPDSGNGSNNESNNGGEDSKTYTMEATAYTGGGITATGTVPVRDPNGLSTVAVDPSVIPLGSKVLVEGYGYAIAADTGGVIKGMKIDLYMNSNEECKNFGRRKVTVHLIE